MTLSGLRGGIRAKAALFLESRLPARTKRLVFLASLSARLKGSDTFDNETLHKLNQVMVLCNTESALKLPVQLSRAIWHGKTSYEIFNANLSSPQLERNIIRQAALRAISAMPSWLRYGDDCAIMEDVERLLDNRLAVLGA
jgi:hypothetical protein